MEIELWKCEYELMNKDKKILYFENLGTPLNLRSAINTLGYAWKIQLIVSGGRLTRICKKKNHMNLKCVSKKGCGVV